MKKIDLDNGKYTVLIAENAKEQSRALRYGESWRESLGNLEWNLAWELSELREKVQTLFANIATSGTIEQRMELKKNIADHFNLNVRDIK